MLHRRISIALLLAAAFLAQGAAQTGGQRALLLISIDGMRPEYVTAADKYD